MAALNRRTFLASATAATAALASYQPSRAASANEKVSIAIMGVNNRGSQLAKELLKIPNAHIAYICDCDEVALGKGLAAATSGKGTAPKAIKDFRQALDDKSVDALFVAAPNHWHAPATILGCAAGKHVYCEKPCSHTPDEGERMIAAGREANRLVQVGLQRRSMPHYIDAIGRLKEGVLGPVLYSRSAYYTSRPSIGRGKEATPPATLDYDLWQGPQLAEPYRDNVIPYNWHNFWHWGNGEVGNNGVHTIDVCRWGLGVDFPTSVTSSGAKLRYEDDQQTPDTNTIAWNVGDRTMVWESLSWSPSVEANGGLEIEFRGEKGALFINDSGYKIYDLKRKVTDQRPGARTIIEHLTNFVDAVRNGGKLNCDIQEGHKSTLYAHLANIAYRTSQTLEIDPSNGHIKSNSPAAQALWACEYRKGWFPGA